MVSYNVGLFDDHGGTGADDRMSIHHSIPDERDTGSAARVS